MSLDFSAVASALSRPDLLASGRVTRAAAGTISAILPGATTGAIYRIGDRSSQPLLAEVIGFQGQEAVLAAFGETKGIGPGTLATPEGLTDEQQLSESILGRAIDALGRPLDGGPPISGEHRLPIYRAAPNPLRRAPISEPLRTGVSVLDLFCTCGRGQRLGIFAGPGVGKSTLMGMLARHSEADVSVVALVGERGREVRAFIEEEIDPETAKRTVLVVATGESAPILRVRCAFLATTIAEFFRDRGHHVLFMMDSVTRLVHALRELGLAAGEPPATRGYPPSVFSTLPKLLERAGNGESKGTMTAFYTVLVEGDDMQEPVADAVRSIVDGHLVLSRRIAEAGRYPALDIPASLSRLAHALNAEPHARLAAELRRMYAEFEELRELTRIGAYQPGADPSADRSLAVVPQLDALFRQERLESRTLESIEPNLAQILGVPRT